jgi:hypothetical protein
MTTATDKTVLSVNTSVFFGVCFEEAHEDCELRHFLCPEFRLDTWWLKHKGFTVDPELTPEQLAMAKRSFLESVPLPVEVVKIGDEEFRSYGLAVPGTVDSICLGIPIFFIPDELSVPEDKVNRFYEFLEETCLNDMDAGWCAASYCENIPDDMD